MVRIIGVDIPNDKRIDIALTYLYGVGRTNVIPVLAEAGIDASRRVKDLTDEEGSRLAKIIEKKYSVEGDLRRKIAENIKRLRDIGCYRGLRHGKKLPVRGQRTRSNARTRRGKRITIGALKKDDRSKVGADKTAPEVKK